MKIGKMIKTRPEIEEMLKKSKPVLSQKYRVKAIGIFGSYVRGEQTKHSDIDVLVAFEEPVSLLAVVKLENYLSGKLGQKVDLVPEKDVRHELKSQITNEIVYL